MSERLPQIIDRLEQDGPIDPRSIDFTIENPALVRQLFEPAFTFSQVVETEVATSTEIVRTALPNMTMVLDRFLGIWKPQELAHGEVLGKQMDVLDIPRGEPR